MFQIAAAVSLAKENNSKAVFNLESHHLPLQGRKVNNYVDNIFRKVEFSPSIETQFIYKEPKHSYNKIPFKENMAIVGYFQSEKYFLQSEGLIRDMFSPSVDTFEYIKKKYGNILKSNPTSIHIRRGDYLKFQNIHPSCTKEYYQNAISALDSGETFLVFSDDPEWCRENFNQKRFVIVENELDYIDMFLMAECKNNIIANSSFSWWAAWLNSNKNKRIIAPSVWFGSDGPQDQQDLIPDSWERV